MTPSLSPTATATTAATASAVATAPLARAKQQQQQKGQQQPLRQHLHFCTVGNPSELKDHALRSANRRHVMNNYLQRERLNPASTDPRVIGSVRGIRRRGEIDVDVGVGVGGAGGSIRAPFRSASARTTVVGTDADDADRRSASPERHRSRGDRNRDRDSDRDRDAALRPARSYPVLPPPLQQDALPSPVSTLGSDLNPFDTWPTLAGRRVGHLKWRCSVQFGSRAMATHWIPEMLKTEHTFLSAICISSAYDDLMERARQQPHERLEHGSRDRNEARGHVLGCISSAMREPDTCTADFNIVAVLQLLSAEVMGCDDTAMWLHHAGLQTLVRQRGGLDRLGLDGQLASILTIIMLVIATIRETPPHPDFDKYAKQMRCSPPPSTDLRPIPESPVYCSASGFSSLASGLAPFNPTRDLLESLRLLTNSFVCSTGSASALPLTPGNVYSTCDQSLASLHLLRDRIFHLRPADSLPPALFSCPVDMHIYEALRLTGLVYAHALVRSVPFSRAATELSLSSPSRLQWHMRIQSHLLRTDLGDCWAHLAGVLFWTTLVAGACANPSSLDPAPRFSEAEESRKWLAAVCVRCSIRLGFEFGGPLLESLKRLVAIQRVLDPGAGGKENPMPSPSLSSSSSSQHLPEAFFSTPPDLIYESADPDAYFSLAAPGAGADGVFAPTAAPAPAPLRFFGPQDISATQLTFAQFAQDFMEESR